MIVYRGDVYLVNIGTENKHGSEQKGDRPCVIIQNNIGNRHSPTTIVAVLTSKEKRNKQNSTYPMHVEVEHDALTGEHLEEDSLLLCEQILTIDKSRLVRKIGYIDKRSDLMKDIDKALMVSLGLY